LAPGAGEEREGAHLRTGVGGAASNAATPSVGGRSHERLREELQAVVRGSLSNMGVAVNTSGNNSGLATHLSNILQQQGSSANTSIRSNSSWGSMSSPSVASTPSSWQENISITLQPSLNSGQAQAPNHSHVLDIEGGLQGQGDQGTEGQTGETGWSQLLNSNPELRAVVSACERYIPFLLIILTKSLFEHGTGIVVCCGLVLTFLHANSVLKQQVARQGRRSLGPLLAITVNLCACLIFIYFVFLDSKLCLTAFFIPPQSVETFVDLVWIVGVNDFILKFLCVLAKIGITLLPARLLPYQKRGKYYLFLEMCSQLHRQLAPLQPWLLYLLAEPGKDTTSIPYKVLGVFLTAAYMVVKGRTFVKALKMWKNAFYKLLQSTRYGCTPSPELIKASGGFCPICQDAYHEPTMLHCKHIFCEECVATWFDRDTTCPMCRAKVSEDPSWRDGATSQFIQLF